MLVSRFFGRQDGRSIRRPLPRRQPLVEALEGRRLLSSFSVRGTSNVNDAGSGSLRPAIVENHIGTNVVQRKHVGPDIVGNHIGTSVVLRKAAGLDIVGNHIGAPMVKGYHIGTSAVDAAVLPKKT